MLHEHSLGTSGGVVVGKLNWRTITTELVTLGAPLLLALGYHLVYNCMNIDK